MKKRHVLSQLKSEYRIGYNLVWRDKVNPFGLLVCKYTTALFRPMPGGADDFLFRLNSMYLHLQEEALTFEAEGNNWLDARLTNRFDEEEWLFGMSFGLDKSLKIQASFHVYGGNPMFVAEVIDRMYGRTIHKLNTEALEHWYNQS